VLRRIAIGWHATCSLLTIRAPQYRPVLASSDGEQMSFEYEPGSEPSPGTRDFDLQWSWRSIQHLPAGAVSRVTSVTRPLARWVRDGDWINRDRIRFYSKLIVVLNVMVIAACIAHGLDSNLASPLGGDFAKCAAASSLALGGHPSDAYDDAKEWAAEKAVTNDPDIGFENWDYPPTFLLIVLPFSFLRYDAALLMWSLLTLAVYLVVMRAIVNRSEGLWLAVAFPGAVVTMVAGQNGLLTMSLLAGGLLLLEAQPIVAGVMFGLLTYKPQFGILIPIVLIATRNWRPFLSATITAITFALLTVMLFGLSSWLAFFHQAPSVSYRLLVAGEVGFGKIQSVFGFARMWDASLATSLGLQGIFSFAVAVVVVWIWLRPVSAALKAAALVTATLMVTPYAESYDYVLLAAPIAWLGAEGLRNGFAAWEKSVLLLAWFFPLLRLVLPTMRLPLTPLVLTIVLLTILRRAGRSRELARLEGFEPPTLRSVV
jgi:alpha-1,2-mannosyltransferase